MKTGDTVIYQVNPDTQRPAKVLRENTDGTVDLSVWLHPDDYPEFSKEECGTGTGIRKNVKEGLKAGEYFYKPPESEPTSEPSA